MADSPSYPIVLPAEERQEFRLQSARRRKRSAIEIVPVAAVARVGLADCIKDNVGVVINEHRYEPDLAFVDEAHAVYIDIEIDEPYSTRGIPTHCWEHGVAKDDLRNHTFQSAGWHVVRFSEKQIFCETDACLRLVCELAIRLGVMEALPTTLQEAGMVTPDPCWSDVESLQRFRNHYRESYLGMSPFHFRTKDLERYFEVGLPILEQAANHPHIRDAVLESLFHGFAGRKK